MKNFYAILSFLFIFVTSTVTAQNFKWNNYPAGSTSSSQNNNGINMNVNVSGNGLSSGFPKYNSNGGGNLATTVNWNNRTSTVTYTFNFSKPLIGMTFLLFDVDQTSSWDDKLTITGYRANNTAIYPMISGTSYAIVYGTNHNIVEGKKNNEEYDEDPVVVSFDATPLKSLTIVYSAGSSSPSNPASQVVGFGALVYENVLPLKLMSFRADKKNNAAELKWETENQENFSHFEIERAASADASFEKIATLNATSTSEGSYSYTDGNAFRLMQKAFYRLKMVDEDGGFTYSAVMTMAFDNAPSVIVSPTLLNAGEMISVNITGDAREKFEVKLFDMSGRMLSQQTASNRIQLSTARLLKGMYIVSVAGATETRSFRVMVQ
ncbi:MAG: T9SS type A sorting domain-containing protein [Sphingobacteriales bacterium]|nr:T9SS type A sorting domain-containing protein [Sphingobacteriales bacterium]